MNQLKMKLNLMVLAIVLLMNPVNSLFAQQATQSVVLFTNANVFDGQNEKSPSDCVCGLFFVARGRIELPTS